MGNKVKKRWFGLFGLALVASCGSDSWDALQASDPDHPAAREHRTRLDIVVGAGTLPSGCDATLRTCTAEQLSTGILGGCPLPGATWATGSCGDPARNAAVQVCAAETLLRLASNLRPETITLASGTIVVPPQDAESQAELARVARERALGAANLVLDGMLSSNCGGTAMETSAASGSAVAGSPITQIKQGEHLAHFAAESLNIVRQAQEATTRYSLAVSDAQRSRATDPAAAEIVELHARASRAYAAHSLVGGADGLPALRTVSQQGFFPRARLTAEGRLALQYIRAAAISPADIANIAPTTAASESGYRSIDQLVFGVDASVASVMASIRGRLGVMLPMGDLFSAADAAAVYTRLGVSREAFVEARAFLNAEQRAFDRDTSRLMPAEHLPGQLSTGEAEATDYFDIPYPAGMTTAVTNLSLFAATRTTPTQPLPVWWSAIVRYDGTPQVLGTTLPTTGPGPAWTWGYGGSPAGYPQGFTFGTETTAATNTVTGAASYLGTLEGISTRVQAVVARIDGTGVFPFSASDRALSGVVATRNRLGGILADIGRPTFTDDAASAPVGRARACVVTASDASKRRVRIDLQVPGLSASDLLVVSTKESLECAVRGSVEGVPCAASDITSGIQSATFAAVGAAAATNGLWAVVGGDVDQTTWQNAARPNVGVRSYFVLRRRPGVSGQVPGGFESVTGWMLSRPATAFAANVYTYCVSTPIAPGIDLSVLEAIAPSTAWAGESTMSCANEPNDLRLPLENELTDDSNGIENSWRHYLNIAQQAANEADMLGETLLDEGLQMDLRAESAVDELEQICGVSINVSPTQAVPSIVQAPCPTGYTAVEGGTSCALDPVRFAIDTRTRSQDQSTLATCLGEDPESSAPERQFAVLGDEPVCLWRDAAAPQTLCVGATNAQPCPFVVSRTASGCGAVPSGMTAIGPIPYSQALGLFTSPTPTSSSATTADENSLPCELLAQHRQDPESLTVDQRRQLFNSPFLTSSGFRAAASQLTVDAIAGDFVQVRFGNSTIASTGTQAGLAAQWPATFPNIYLCPGSSPFPSGDTRATLHTYTGPLFCIQQLGAELQSTSSAPMANSIERRARAAVNNLLIRATLAARIVSGSGISGNRLPLYLRRTTDWLNITDGDFALVPGHTSVFESNVGSVYYDNDGDGPGPIRTPLSDTNYVAQYVSGYPEWLYVPYDAGASASYVSYDSEFLDWAPTPSHNPPTNASGMPMLAWTLGTSMDSGGNVQVAAASAWGDHRVDRTSAPIFRILMADRSNPTFREGTILGIQSDLSQYYRFWYDNQNTVGLITPNDVFNGIELACYAARTQRSDPLDAGCERPPEFRTMRDFLRADRYLECVADRTTDRAARSVIRGLPASVITEVQAGGSSTTGQYSGEYGAQLADIRSALLALRTHQTGISNDIRQFASVLRTTNNAVQISDLQARIEDIQIERELANSVVECIAANNTAGASFASFSWGAGAAQAGTATAVCSNSAFQWMRATEINRLRDQAGVLELDSAFANADREFVNTSASIRAHAIGISAEYARIDGALTRIRSLQTRARTALSRALFLDNSTTGRAFAVDTVMRRRYDTTLARYTAAHQRAIRLAFIARRALEQRLGMNLDEMNDDLLTVTRPSRWANELCTLPAMDYERIRNSGDPTLASPDGYSGTYVGDYVRRLEQVFESYSFNYPFQDGTDTAVISLRDDVMHVMRPCEADLPNLLYNSGALDVLPTTSRRGWQPIGCSVPSVDKFCISATLSPADSPVSSGSDRYGTARPYLVSFGDLSSFGARLGQIISAERGRYRVSYWAREDVGGFPLDKIVKVRRVDTGDEISRLALIEADAGSGWYRYSFFVDVPDNMDIEVSVNGEPHAVVHIAGVQLEAAAPNFYGELTNGSGTGAAQRFPPGRFYDTGDDRRGVLPVCRDDGTEFRRSAFTRGCVRVCRDGYDGTCAAADATTRCFLETSIDVSSDTLQRVLTGGPAGFASGNFNYRMETVGVNLVGTGLRDCGATGSSGCFGSGNFAISMIHEGPYLVRNAVGGLYEAPLFTGRIESARALSAERYLSNPISSADMALIQPYSRREFRGRPLGGTLHLRIWEDDTFRYDRLADVQLVLNYRYWTHQR